MQIYSTRLQQKSWKNLRKEIKIHTRKVGWAQNGGGE